MNLSLTIKRGSAHLPQRVGLNLVDLANNPGNILVESWGHLSG